MRNAKWISGALLGSAMLMLVACNDNDEPQAKGDVEFEITDAPTDEANVKGVFVTIADVKIDGKSVSGFTKQTIDLKAYQEGNTKVLAGAEQLDAKTYNNLTLVLDMSTDANGNSPGSYVLTQSDVKYKLRNTTSGTMDVVIAKSWDVAANTKSSIVLDFDLRKAVIHDGDSYSFVSDNELSSAIRVVNKANTGTVQGTYNEETISGADQVIVYAYKKGTYTAATETTPQGDSDILFVNAVGSAKVKSSLSGNTYKLAMLESGDYEFYFAAYKKETGSDRMVFQNVLQAEISVNGGVEDMVAVQAGTTINILSSIKGIL